MRIPVSREAATAAKKRIIASSDEPWYFGFLVGYGRVCVFTILFIGIPVAVASSLDGFSANPGRAIMSASLWILLLLAGMMPAALAFVIISVARDVRELKSRD